MDNQDSEMPLKSLHARVGISSTTRDAISASAIVPSEQHGGSGINLDSEGLKKHRPLDMDFSPQTTSMET